MQRWQLVGAILAVLGTALVVLAALQAATFLLGDSVSLALVIGVAGFALLASGGGMMLRDSRT